ncbi:MAG: hypothetical protein NZ700_04785 [Gemmataceae bacterium]|nr:hypothetical protein [Gemmataceae bacterium]MDW8264059.1 hypothetical protein [Gemmataceae bacterium]
MSHLYSGNRVRRKGQALVEYALLLAGIALACVVAVAVIGHKTADVIAVMAGIMPGAHADDNAPIQAGEVIPFESNGSALVLDSSELVSSSGLDRMQNVLGAGGGALLVLD